MPSRSIIKRLQKDDDDFYPMYEGGKKDKGEKYKDEMDKFKAPEGMNMDRSCTDCLCSIVFIAFLASMIFLTYLGFS
jgi:hypothetical protein